MGAFPICLEVPLQFHIGQDSNKDCQLAEMRAVQLHEGSSPCNPPECALRFRTASWLTILNVMVMPVQPNF